MISPVTTMIALLAGALLACEAGHQLGSRLGPRDEVFQKQFAVIRGATLALVGFLVAFSFSGAAARYVDRLDIIVKEANALGTAYLRSDVLTQPSRDRLKDILRQYTADRLDLLDNPDTALQASRLARVGDFHRRMWEAGLNGTEGQPQLTLLVLPALNEVIDLHTTHLSAALRHVPLPILTLLIASSALALGLTGFGNGMAGRRFPVLNFVYGAILASALWMTIDLDHSRQGMIQASIRPIAEALASMKPN